MRRPTSQISNHFKPNFEISKSTFCLLFRRRHHPSNGQRRRLASNVTRFFHVSLAVGSWRIHGVGRRLRGSPDGGYRRPSLRSPTAALLRPSAPPVRGHDVPRVPVQAAATKLPGLDAGIQAEVASAGQGERPAGPDGGIGAAGDGFAASDLQESCGVAS